jgi:hypothetical protein
MQINKSDRKDAIGIARMMQTGGFKEVHVKDIDSHSARALPASRSLLLKVLGNSSKTTNYFSKLPVAGELGFPTRLQMRLKLLIVHRFFRQPTAFAGEIGPHWWSTQGCLRPRGV